jgi:hypothetical protein
MVQGWYKGIEFVRPRRVVVLLLKHLPNVADTLEVWLPVHHEPIVVYSYPSYSVLFEGATDSIAWTNAMKASKKRVRHMTPATNEELVFNIQLRYMPSFGTFSQTMKVPGDRILNVRVDPEQTISPIGQFGIGLVIAATITVSAVGIFYYLKTR